MSNIEASTSSIPYNEVQLIEQMDQMLDDDFQSSFHTQNFRKAMQEGLTLEGANFKKQHSVLERKKDMESNTSS